MCVLVGFAYSPHTRTLTALPTVVYFPTVTQETLEGAAHASDAAASMASVPLPVDALHELLRLAIAVIVHPDTTMVCVCVCVCVCARGDECCASERTR